VTNLDQTAPLPTIDGQVTSARLAMRLTIVAIVDLIAIHRGERNALDSLLIAAITQANIAPITRQGDLQVAYAGVDDITPDDMRRPISINALANSLNLPFETVRRRVKGLLARGEIATSGDGLIVPAHWFASPAFVADGVAMYERASALYCELRDLGLTGPLPPPTVRLEAGAAPVRIVARLLNAFLLRVLETLMRRHGDVLDVLILLQVFCCNTEHFTVAMAGGEGMDEADMVPDLLRQPVRPSSLARRLGLPFETVRRHTDQLAARGAVVRAPRGFIVPAGAMARPEFRASMLEALTAQQRLLAGLSQLGVLAVWDAANPPQAQPAAAAL
jgi:hypothetical protein